MPTDTNLIALLKAGESAPVGLLWERYYPRLVELALDRLRLVRRRVADEEDVAISAFASFIAGARAGRFPRLTDRTDLWKLLVFITARKAADLAVRERCQKRGNGQVRGESAFPGPDAERGIEQVVGSEPTPEFAVQVAEQYERLLECLGDDTLRAIAQWKLEGYTNEEIKGKLACSLAKVERKLALIRGIWQQLGLA